MRPQRRHLGQWFLHGLRTGSINTLDKETTNWWRIRTKGFGRRVISSEEVTRVIRVSLMRLVYGEKNIFLLLQQGHWSHGQFISCIQERWDGGKVWPLCFYYLPKFHLHQLKLFNIPRSQNQVYDWLQKIEKITRNIKSQD